MQYKRSQSGSMLFLMVCVTAVIVIPIFILLAQFGPLAVYQNRAENVVEAASKIAAIDLSRVVINDPAFGFVSLSNQPPSGKGTLAADGEPLPVTGINTLVGTLRQNAILADELHNDSLQALVDRDHDSLDATIKTLNKTLCESVSEERSRAKLIDMDGKLVEPLADVKTFLSENLPSHLTVESVKLTVGWLDGGSETTIAAPQPPALAQLKPKNIQDGKYTAFENLPVAGKNFRFAGLGPQPHLVSTGSFAEPDGTQICSVVKLECTLLSKEQPQAKIQLVSCCQAYTKPDTAPRGAMTLRFCGRPVPGLLSWNELLTKGYFMDNRLTDFDVVGGDFPYERDSRLRQTQSEAGSSTGQQFAEHFYNWLRSGHLRPRLDSVLAMINESFQPYLNEVYTYEFCDDGTISRKAIEAAHFARAVSAEGQSVVMADTRVRSGASAIIFFRDNVASQNVEESKHAGQPLVGYPLGAVEGTINPEELEATFSQRQSHQDGLAVDIEIGGTGDSTARNDVVSMRERTKTRRI